MRKLVVFPSDPIEAYIEKGRSYKYIEDYYNPGGYFDEVYCLSPWGDRDEEVIGRMHYIKASPYEFAPIIAKIRPDAVRGYGSYCCADWVSFNKVEGIPTVVSVHDTNPKLMHQSLAYADMVICMSEAVKDAVRQCVPGVTSNIRVMPNRIDTELYSHKEDAAVFAELDRRFPGKHHLLHVGRKTEQKNPDTVIRAMKYLDADVVTVFVGRGDTELYRELARSEGVLERCYFVDRVDNSELPYWYSWSDCMCTPSRWEGFGFVFIEAAACETVVVTSNLAPMNEYLSDGENAILVKDYENPEALAAAVKHALEDSEEIRGMKKNAREVGLRFSKEEVDKQEIAIYEEVFGLTPNNRNNDALRRKLYRLEHASPFGMKLYKFFSGLYHKVKKLFGIGGERP